MTLLCNVNIILTSELFKQFHLLFLKAEAKLTTSTLCSGIVPPEGFAAGTFSFPLLEEQYWLPEPWELTVSCAVRDVQTKVRCPQILLCPSWKVKTWPVCTSTVEDGMLQSFCSHSRYDWTVSKHPVWLACFPQAVMLYQCWKSFHVQTFLLQLWQHSRLDSLEPTKVVLAGSQILERQLEKESLGTASENLKWGFSLGWFLNICCKHGTSETLWTTSTEARVRKTVSVAEFKSELHYVQA